MGLLKAIFFPVFFIAYALWQDSQGQWLCAEPWPTWKYVLIIPLAAISAILTLLAILMLLIAIVKYANED